MMKFMFSKIFKVCSVLSLLYFIALMLLAEKEFSDSTVQIIRFFGEFLTIPIFAFVVIGTFISLILVLNKKSEYSFTLVFNTLSFLLVVFGFMLLQ